MSPSRVALGGGITVVSGTDAHFLNPANLYLPYHRETRYVTLSSGMIHDHEGYKTSDSQRFLTDTKKTFYSLDPLDSEQVHNRNTTFLSANSPPYLRSRSYDMVPLGVGWRSNTAAHSFALRSRGSVSYSFTRDAHSELDHVDQLYNSGMHEKNLQFHEISYAYAREVTMFNRWRPGLSTLVIGIAPKLLLGGMYADVIYKSEYKNSTTPLNHIRTFDARYSGDYASFASSLLQGKPAHDAYSDAFGTPSLFKISGTGFGMDMGLTYIIPLGNDVSLSSSITGPLRKSLRFSLAITDLGYIRFNDNESYKIALTDKAVEEPVSIDMWTSVPSYGALTEYVLENEFAIVEHPDMESSSSSFTVQLPTELHVGTAIQYHDIMALLDLNYRFHSYDFLSDGWGGSLAVQIRYPSFLPLMASIQLDPDRNVYYGFGAGIDFGAISVQGSIRLFTNASDQNRLYTHSLSTLGLTLRF